MKFEYNDEKHEYFLDGEKCPSVTEILNVLGKPGMEWWSYRLVIEGLLTILRQATVDPNHPAAFNMLYKALGALELSPHAVADNACKRGKAVHQAFVDYAITGKWPDYKEVAGYIESLKAFFAEHKPTLIDFEKGVYSPSMRICGTYDALFEIGGELVLVDWKTSKAARDSHHIQVAAYEGMRQEHGEPPANPLVVCLAADGSAPVVTRSKATYEDFKAAIVLHQAMKRVRSKKKEEKVVV